MGVSHLGVTDSSILWHTAEETGDSRSIDAGGQKTDTHPSCSRLSEALVVCGRG